MAFVYALLAAALFSAALGDVTTSNITTVSIAYQPAIGTVIIPAASGPLFVLSKATRFALVPSPLLQELLY